MKLKYIGMSLLLMAGLSSCYDDELGNVIVPEQNIEVSFKFSGEISSGYSPLTRTTSTNDLIGVQVYKGTENFAYGLFDNVEDMNIYLQAGSKYKFILTVVKDGKNKIRTYSDGYSYPFYYQHYVKPNTYRYYYKLTDTFNYTSDNYYFEHINLGSGYSDLGSIDWYPETDRFYGELENYTPTVGGTVNMELKRASFGLKYEISGISDGSVSITIKNSSRTFFENSGISETYASDSKIFTFSNVRDSWLYSDNYVENVEVSMKWMRSIGIEQDLGSKTVQIKRNAMNNIRVSLSEDYGGSALKIDVEDAAMGNETVTIPVAP